MASGEIYRRKICWECWAGPAGPGGTEGP